MRYLISLSQERGYRYSAAKHNSPSIWDDLEHWEQLVFSLDMDKDNESSHTNRITQPEGPRSMPSSKQPSDASWSGLHDTALVAQIAAASGFSAESDHSLAHLLNSNLYPPAPLAPGYYSNFFPHGAMEHTQLIPVSSLDFTWNQLVHQQGLYNLLLPTSFVPFPNTLQGAPVPSTLPPQQPDSRARASSASPSQLSQPRATFIPARSPSVPANSPTEADADQVDSASVEEKRRRNTAASARFRTKKKQRTINLERSVSDLSSRAVELEKEAAELRRENGWLKEIVFLKGSRYAAAARAQQRMALSQAAQGAGIDLMVQGAGLSGTKSTGTSTSGVAMQLEEISYDEESDDYSSEVGKKKRGKKPATKGKRK